MKKRTTLKKTIALGLGMLSLVLMGPRLAAQSTSTATDSVCAGASNVTYGITNARSSSDYHWFLNDTAAGTIDSTVATNDSLIRVSWTTSPGSYTLSAIELTSGGCYGDTVQLTVVVRPLPTALMTADSICAGSAPQVTFTFTGQAPWVFSYSDGSQVFNDTAAVSPYVTTVPATYSNPQTLSMTSLTDANSCAADTAGLPSTPVNLFSQPTTGPIYHF